MLARYEAAANLPPVIWPPIPPAEDKLPLFRQASAMCLQPVASKVVSSPRR